MLIDTNFTSANPGAAGDSGVYNANLAKIEQYLNEVLAYIESYMSDLSGDGQGIVDGCELTDGGALIVNAALGNAWVGGDRVSVDAAAITVTDDATCYIYLDQDGDYSVDSVFGFYTTKIPRAKVIAAGGDITSLLEYDNRIFTMDEMMLHRITPFGLLVTNDGVDTIVNVSYLDPAETGIQSIVIEGSDDDGATWSELATVTI
jgi:hypothetical protein